MKIQNLLALSEAAPEPSKEIPTKQQIGAVLRAAGFEASKSLTSRVRGFRTLTRGYSLNTYVPIDDCPVVSYVGSDKAKEEKESLDHYEAALKKRFTVERRSDMIIVKGFLKSS